jgi:hypothetical protein
LLLVIELADDVQTALKQLALKRWAVGGVEDSPSEQRLEVIQRFNRHVRNSNHSPMELRQLAV